MNLSICSWDRAEAVDGTVQTPLPAGVSTREATGSPLLSASPSLIWTAVTVFVMLERTTVPVRRLVAVSNTIVAVPLAAELTDGVVTTCLSFRKALRLYCRDGAAWGCCATPFLSMAPMLIHALSRF